MKNIIWKNSKVILPYELTKVNCKKIKYTKFVKSKFYLS